MPQTSADPITRLHRQANFKVLFSLLILGAAAILVFFILAFTRQQVKQVATARQELVSLQGVAQNTQALAQFAKQNQANLALLAGLFPAEDDFIYVLQDLEALVLSADPEAQVKLGASQPVKVNGQNTLPLTIHLSVSPDQLSAFLRQFERLPYILEITNLEQAARPEGGSLKDVLIQVRLYVADPFSP